MDASIALRRWLRPQRLGGVLLLALAACLAWSWWPSAERPAGAVPADQLVHWQDARHDWLLVVDPATRELVVYDANDGRPLDRLGADDGLPPEVGSIERHGSWLLVTGRQQPDTRLLKLPELEAIAASGP